MTPEAQQVRQAFHIATAALSSAKARLDQLVSNCARRGHSWGEVTYTPEHRAAYTIPGDRPGDPGFGGVDRRFDCHVPSETIKKYTRVCQCCGEAQTVGPRTVHKTEDVPNWG